MADFYEEIGHVIFGSPARTRTTDMVVNSHPLYRLSYWGMKSYLLTCIEVCVKSKNTSKSQHHLFSFGQGLGSHDPAGHRDG